MVFRDREINHPRGKPRGLADSRTLIDSYDVTVVKW